MHMQRTSRTPTVSALRIAATGIGLFASSAARASLFTGDTLDAVANGVAWAVLVLVPIIGITVFWLVHVLPEKIAHKRHHPQTKAIQTLCLLSLVFGGLLWPIAWLWAYTKPVAHKLAYGTDKSDDFFHEADTKARAGTLVDADIAHVKRELDAMRARGALPPELARLHDDLIALDRGAPVVESRTAAVVDSRTASTVKADDDVPVLASPVTQTPRRSA